MPYDLVGVIRGQAGMENIAVTHIDSPAVGDDLPQVDRFPEGDPFRMVAMRTKEIGQGKFMNRKTLRSD